MAGPLRAAGVHLAEPSHQLVAAGHREDRVVRGVEDLRAPGHFETQWFYSQRGSSLGAGACFTLHVCVCVCVSLQCFGQSLPLFRKAKQALRHGTQDLLCLSVPCGKLASRYRPPCPSKVTSAMTEWPVCHGLVGTVINPKLNDMVILDHPNKDRFPLKLTPRRKPSTKKSTLL